MKGTSLLVPRETGLLCVTVLWWKSSDKKGHNISFGDQIKEPSKMLSELVGLRKKRLSWNNLGKKTIEFFISWHRNE